MAGLDNEIHFNRGVRIAPTGSTQYPILQKNATDLGEYNVAGSPEGVASANIGSTARDRTNGVFYIKRTGTGNTGWVSLGSGDVVGPAGATDNAICRYDSTTGKLIQNSVPTIDDTGNLAISADVSGASLSSTVANTSNTASATAFYNAQVAGSTASDAYYKAEIAGGQAWTWGLDNSDSDAFVLSLSASLGTNNVMRASAATGNIVFSTTSAGGTTSTTTANLDNTNAASHASYIIQTAGSSAGDPYLNLAVSGVQSYSLGIDNSDSDKLKMTPGGLPSGGEFWVATSAGEINMPLQPAFLAYLGTTDSNCTGDGTAFVVGSGNALTEVFDQNGDFNTNGTFTAPVTGKVHLTGMAQLTGGTVLSSSRLYFSTSNGDYTQFGDGQTTSFDQCISITLEMDAGDIAQLIIRTTDSGGKIDDLIGSSTTRVTNFSGFLAV